MLTEKQLAAMRANAKKSAAANWRKVECICKACNKVFLLAPSLARIQGKFCSNPCRYKFKRGPNGANAGNHAGIAGAKNPRWKGGVTDERKLKHRDAEVQQWRRSVFYRDNYTCQRCRIEGLRLRAHHISAWATYPDLRFDVNNGITLCKACHDWVHSSENLESAYIKR